MRLIGLDIARFAAFVGMVLVNFRLAAEVTPGADAISIFTNAFEGRAAALFVVLAGLGFALAKQTWQITLRRAGFLFVLGMVNQTIFEADILHFYALYFLVAAIFAGRSQTMLFIGAVGFVFGWLALAGVVNYETGWDWETLHYQDFWTLPGFLRHSLFNGWHPVLPWAGFFLIGMWVGGLDLAARKTQILLTIGGIFTAAAAGISAPIASNLSPEIAEIAMLSPIPPGPFYMIAATATALAAIGAILLVTPWLTRLGIANFLALAGRQSLTLYIAHILIGMGVLELFGWLDGGLSPGQIFTFSLVFCLICIFYAWGGPAGSNAARWKH